MKTNSQLDTLSTQVGDLIHNWGFKRIHGRIYTRLFLSTRPLDAADLIEQLDISKALVSISLRELLDVKAVEEVGRSARGTNLFRANGDLQTIYLETLKKRERTMLEQTSAALAALNALEASDLNALEISGTQMDKLADHLKTASRMLNVFVDQHEGTSNGAIISFAAPAGAMEASFKTSSMMDASSSASAGSSADGLSPGVQTATAHRAHAGY